MKIKLATQEQLENVKSETFENMIKKQDKLTAGDVSSKTIKKYVESQKTRY